MKFFQLENGNRINLEQIELISELVHEKAETRVIHTRLHLSSGHEEFVGMEPAKFCEAAGITMEGSIMRKEEPKEETPEPVAGEPAPKVAKKKK